MQVTELESNGLKKSFKIVVEASVIQVETEAELRSAGERVKIPGFRPGFIPMKVLQQRYGKSVQADVLKQVINRSSSEALTQKNIRPAVTPSINIEDYKEGGELVYTMSVEAFPQMPDVAFDKVKLDRSVYEIEEKHIEEAIERVAERSPTLARAKDGARTEMGDVVQIDFQGMIEGVPFEGGSATDFRLELGSNQFIPGFEEQLVGAKEGEVRNITVTFPENYPAAHLAGKPTQFTVKIKEVHVKETPEINEEFVKARGFGDMRAFKEAVRGQLVKEYDQIVRRQLKKQLFDQLETAYDFELPASMVEMEFNAIWERLQEARKEGDTSVEGRSDDDLKKEYQAIANRRVKLGLLLADIGMRNNVQVSREELSRAVMQQASMFPGQEKKVMEFYRNNPERIEDMRGPILEEKAVDFILGKVSFNDQKISVDDLAASEEDEDGDAPKKTAKAKPKAKPAKSEEESDSAESKTAKPKARKKAAE